MFGELISSFLLNFFAELGDKTQLAALMLAARYGFRKVFQGIFAAILLLQALAVLGGSLAQNLLSNKPLISLIASAIFLIFGFMIFRDSESEEEKIGSSASPVVMSFLMFFSTELGDKTQIATMLKAATSSYLLATYIGASLGLTVSNAAGILAGKFLGNRIDEKKLKYAGAFIFLAFGIYYLIDGLKGFKII